MDQKDRNNMYSIIFKKMLSLEKKIFFEGQILDHSVIYHLLIIKEPKEIQVKRIRVYLKNLNQIKNRYYY